MMVWVMRKLGVPKKTSERFSLQGKPVVAKD